MPIYSEDNNTGSALSSLSPSGNSDNSANVSVSDVTDDNLFMSPEEINAYNEYQQNRQNLPDYTAPIPASTGALPLHAYYPNVGQPIGVGQSSGSIIGSHTIYAPAQGLVPFGMMDARSAAIANAALQKQKEADAFRKQFAKAPTSKLSNINESLTDSYFQFHNDAWNKALRNAKGNPSVAAESLRNDPDFWQKNQSYKNLALQGDAIVGKLAGIDSRIKSGDLVSPSERAMMDKIRSESLNPESPEFKNLAQDVMKLDASMELTRAIDEVLKPMVEQVTGIPINLSNPNEYKIYKETVANLPKDAIDAAERNLLTRYNRSSLYSPERIKKDFRGYTNWEKRTGDLNISPKHDVGSTYDNDNVVPLSGEKINKFEESVSGGQLHKTSNTPTEHYVAISADDQKKELRIAVSKSTIAADGTPVNKGESGYIKGTVQGIGVKPYYDKYQRFLTDAEVEKLKQRGDYDKIKGIEMRPVVIFNATTPSKRTISPTGETVIKPGQQETYYDDLNKIKGVFKNPRNKGKDFDSMVEKTIKYAQDQNKARASINAPAATPQTKKVDTKKDFGKEYGF